MTASPTITSGPRFFQNPFQPYPNASPIVNVFKFLHSSLERLGAFHSDRLHGRTEREFASKKETNRLIARTITDEAGEAARSRLKRFQSSMVGVLCSPTE